MSATTTYCYAIAPTSAWLILHQRYVTTITPGTTKVSMTSTNRVIYSAKSQVVGAACTGTTAYGANACFSNFACVTIDDVIQRDISKQSYIRSSSSIADGLDLVRMCASRLCQGTPAESCILAVHL